MEEDCELDHPNSYKDAHSGSQRKVFSFPSPLDVDDLYALMKLSKEDPSAYAFTVPTQ